jgi:hypothetical protein
MIGLIKQLGQVTQREYDASGSVTKANATFKRHKDMLLDAARSMGISRKDLDRLIGKYLEAKGKINAATGGIKDRKVRIEVRAGGELIGYKVQGGTLLKKDGGVLPGYTPGRDVHMFTSPTGGALGLSGGESVMRPEWTKAVGPNFVNFMNKAARTGGVPGVKRALSKAGVPGEGAFFKGGGIISSHSMTGVNKIASVAQRANALYAMWAKNIGTGISKAFSNMLGVGGPKVRKALAWAKKQHGKPYIWGGSGPRGWDCSGFMGSIAAIIKGKNPYARYFSTHSFGSSGPMGFKRNLKSGFTVGVTHAGVGHMAGTLGKTNVESRGSRGVVVGRGARGTNSSLFGARYGMKLAQGGMIPFSGIFDQGGVLPRGFSAVYNGTGGAETLRPSTSAGTGSASMGGDLIINELNVYGVQDVEDLVKKIQKFAKDRGGITLRIRT